MKGSPEVSVIIPVFNGEKTIRECLESLGKQDFRNGYEVIVVDDGSTDGTKKKVRKMRNVILIEQNHKGPAAARNLGAKQANGKILIFTDSDCIADKGWIKEMAKPFSGKEIIGVQGSYRTKQKPVIARFSQLEIEDRYDRMRKRKYIDFVGSYSAAYRRDVFLSSGGFDESFPMASGEDPELSFKLAESGKRMVFNENAVVYHMHPDSLGKYLKQKFWRAYWRVFLYKKHPKKIKSESYTPQTLKIQMFLSLILLASLFSPLLGISKKIPAIIFLVFVLSEIPLSLKNFRKDKAVGLITPPVVFLRSVSFSAGMALGMLGAKRKSEQKR